MIFSSAELGDKATVQFLSVFVILITVAMSVWLVAQLIRECVHEKGEAAVAVVNNMAVLRRRISSEFRRVVRESRLGTTAPTNVEDGVDVEMRVWAVPVNPMLEHKKNDTGTGD